MKLYNTLTRNKEEFVPIDKELIKLYTCGPTVYSYAHIGNLRAYIFMDGLRRILKYNGYKIKHAMNITDVGHLVSDADEGEDKMIKASKIQNQSPMEIAQKYADIFIQDLKRLNVDMPEIICKATDHIPEMIDYVKKLIENGYAYETSTTIYFDVSKLDKYGVLSNRNLDDQIAGARVEVDKEKRNPYDFALWIKAPKEHLMKWESPWGLSYPGWHIECSAMGRKYLGEEFDIHTGGVDHIPTHHENEIAQAKGLTGKIPARYWLHNEFLLVDGGKMSKSLGNCYTISQLIEQGFSPLDFKMFTFNSHYRNKLNFTFDGLKAAKVSLNRLKELIQKHKGVDNKTDERVLLDIKQRFLDAINDDLNTPLALSILWEAVKLEKSDDIYLLALDFDRVFGLKLDEYEEEKKEEIPMEILEMSNKRTESKKNKDYTTADNIRNEIKEKGYILEDTKDGVIIKKI